MKSTEMHVGTEYLSRPRREGSLGEGKSVAVSSGCPGMLLPSIQAPGLACEDYAAWWVEALCGHYTLCSWPLLRPHFRLIEALLALGL